MFLIFIKKTLTNSIDIVESIMDFLRQIVGGPKNRYKQQGYNLDLTYITPRIIAMAFPASGFQKLYRNDIDSIAQLLQANHKGKYIIINISGRSINQKVLKNVVSYDWQDHKAPPFDLLFTICEKVARFLSEDIERIAVFHCSHGKGRTGTIICCFFLYMAVFSDYKQVMKFYAKRRFERDGYGVTQPCQIKYIEYFQNYLYNPNVYPQVLCIKKLTLKGDFYLSNPYIQIINNNTGAMIYSTQQIENSIQLEKANEYVIKLTKKHCFAGDISIDIKEVKFVGKDLLISYVFNTTFIEYQKVLNIKLKDLSPLGKQKQSVFGQNFQIDVEFRKFCGCGGNEEILQCSRCNGAMISCFQRWRKIKFAFLHRQQFLPIGKIICFGNQSKVQQ